jgi:hypothetical protein
VFQVALTTLPPASSNSLIAALDRIHIKHPVKVSWLPRKRKCVPVAFYSKFCTI